MKKNDNEITKCTPLKSSYIDKDKDKGINHSTTIQPGNNRLGDRKRPIRTKKKKKYHPQKITSYEPFNGLKKVISGGQTGADRGALEAAQKLGIPTGGTAPAGFKTENGSDYSLKEFGLVESRSKSYPFRTKKNVDDSDGTLAFRLHISAGTDKTIGWCHEHNWVYGRNRGQSKDKGWRPVHVITNLDEKNWVENIENLQNFISRNEIRILNVAGHRETTAGMKDFQNTVVNFLIEALRPYKPYSTSI